jgi:2,5-diamino-6-(ribosylamino)-4(3H)-pyrimidinone 5'-phosphate reductase
VSQTRPYVIVNVAASADGKIDTCERRGAAISSERDRQRVDELRASVDAVMVGSHTLHDEDPRLTVKSEALRAARLARGVLEHPAKVAVASHLGLNPGCRFLTSGRARVIVFVPRGAADRSVNGVEIYETGDRRVDLVDVMSTLGRLGLLRVLVEGGGTLNFELLRLGLVDEVQVSIGPMIFGGATSPTLADGTGLTRANAIQLGKPTVDVWQDGSVVLRYMVERS